MTEALEVTSLLEEADHIALSDAKGLLAQLNERHVQIACSQMAFKPFSEPGWYPHTP